MPAKYRHRDFDVVATPGDYSLEKNRKAGRQWKGWLAGLTGMGSLLGGVIWHSSNCVPELTDRRWNDAKSAATRAGLTPLITTRPTEGESTGFVIAQDPVAGTRFKNGTTISLIVAAPPVFKEPLVGIMNAQLRSCYQDRVEILVKFEVENPNPVDVELEWIGGHIKLAGLQPGDPIGGAYDQSAVISLVISGRAHSLFQTTLVMSAEQFLDAIKRLKFVSLRQKPGIVFDGHLKWRSLDQPMPDLKIIDWTEMEITSAVASPMSLSTDPFLRELAQLLDPEGNYTRDPSK